MRRRPALRFTAAALTIRTSAVDGANGAPINPGFLGEQVRTEANFARLTDPNYAT